MTKKIQEPLMVRKRVYEDNLVCPKCNYEGRMEVVACKKMPLKGWLCTIGGLGYGYVSKWAGNPLGYLIYYSCLK